MSIMSLDKKEKITVYIDGNNFYENKGFVIKQRMVMYNKGRIREPKRKIKKLIV